MIRIILFLVSLAVIAAGVGWIADRPGKVSVTWMGYRIETSLTVAFFAVVALVVVLMTVWWIISVILHSPEYASLFFKHRRVAKGYLAVTRGLIAIGAGDLRVARKAAEEAARLSPRDPLALLLGAQSAQLAGDRSGAERAFNAMTAREDTRALGLRGLYIEAQRRNDLEAARRAAEEAASARGNTAEALMEEAGAGIARSIVKFFPRPGKCIVFAGKGHNAGDVFVAARHLAQAGWEIQSRVIFPKKELSGLTKKKLSELVASAVSTNSARRTAHATIILDGLLGLGAHPPLREPIRSACREINSLGKRGAQIIAIDLPTGLDGESGVVDEDCVVADFTITIACAKSGLQGRSAGANAVNCSIVRRENVDCIGILQVLQSGY